MEIDPLIIQFAISLTAILALFLLARWLKLGGQPMLSSKEGVRKAAGEVVDGFEMVDAALDDSGAAALARDADGQVILIKRHGNKFAGRLLGTGSKASTWRDDHPEGRRRPRVTIDSGDTLFGKVTITTDNPETWASAVNGL